MAKYVCDTEVVSEAGKNICDITEEMMTSVTNYSTESEETLSGWDGLAKGSFSRSMTSHIEGSKNDFNYINAFGQYIQGSAKAIDELEKKLADVKI